MHIVASAFRGICPSTFSNEPLLVLGLHTHIARRYRFDSETVFSPDRAVAVSSSSSFPSSLHLGPRDPHLEMWLAVRRASIWIRLVIRIRLVIQIRLVIRIVCGCTDLSLNHVKVSEFPARDCVIPRRDVAHSFSEG